MQSKKYLSQFDKYFLLFVRFGAIVLPVGRGGDADAHDLKGADILKQKELSSWLKAITLLLGLCCAVLAVLIAPEQGHEFVLANPEYADLFAPCLAVVELTFLPVLAALWQVWGIATEIGLDNSFCVKNALRLRSISRLALLDTMVYIIMALTLLAMGRAYPYFIFVVVCVVFMGLCFTVVCAALSHLTRKAADMKSENDMTI